MPLAREQRKLAAIVAADVVGYSRRRASGARFFGSSNICGLNSF
jgi:hypothetical protein